MQATFRAWAANARNHERAWRRWVVATGIAVLLIQWISLGFQQRGDFKLHWELGRRLAAGTFIYQPSPGGDPRGLDFPYPPFWALAHAPLTILSCHAAQLVLYPLAALALVGLLRVLHRLCEKSMPVRPAAAFWLSAAAVALAGRFLVRDAVECGVNLALVALSWLGILLWTKRREGWGGISLGLAMALKCTPALFLVYFAWKRQWRMAAYSSAAAFLFSVSPLLWIGPTEFVRTFGHWAGNAWAGVGHADPSHGVLGPEPLQNLSLRPALARFLMHLPPGHKGRFDHPLSIDFLNLSPATAGAMIKFALAGLLIGVAWAFRRPVRDRNSPAVVWECAAVSLLILLYSPITWGQHCVGVLPALFLLCRFHYAVRAHSRWVMGALIAYAALIVLLNRGVIGKDLTYLLNNYHVTTWCLPGLLAAVIACRQSSERTPPAGPVVSAAIPLPSLADAEKSAAHAPAPLDHAHT